MSVYLYDEAVISRLQEITGDNRIRIISPENATSFLAQIDKDKVNYPAILLRRRSPITILEDRKNQYAMLKGQTVRYNTEENTVTKAKLLPIRITWDVDVYAADRKTCDEIIRELIWFFVTYPRFKVQVPYGLDIPQNFDITLNSDIEDNTDLLDFASTGELFRESLSIFTDNAHFYSSQHQYLTKVKPDVENSK